MAKYDVHRLEDGTLVIDCQSDHIRLFDTRLVIPLLPVGKNSAPVNRLEPLLTIGDDRLILTTHLLAAVFKSDLGRPVDHLAQQADAIGTALDMLIYGF